MTVRIVCDSTANLDPDWARQHQVTVVPLGIIFGDQVFADGVDISAAEFYERIANDPNVMPRTTQPTPAEFEAAFRSATNDGSAVICTTISAAMSGTHQAAVLAAGLLPDRNIQVVDTSTVAVGLICLPS